MAYTLYCKVVLNQRFSNVINMSPERHIGLKKKYYQTLRECIPLLFSRINYPQNVGGATELEYGVIKSSHYEASVLIKVEVELPPLMDQKELEGELKKHNMCPEFIKKVSVVSGV